MPCTGRTRQTGRGGVEHERPAADRGRHEQRRSVADRTEDEAVDAEAIAVDPTGCVAATGRREHHGARRRVEPEALQHHGAERTGRGSGPALLLERQRHGVGPVARQGVVPTELAERLVERGARRRRHDVRQAPLEQLAVLGVHQRSSPRSSRRRAMMLRWISALPP